MRTLLLATILSLTGCVIESYHRREMAPPPEPPVTRAEVERLATAGVSDEVILELVDRRGAPHLSAEDLVALKQAGASDAVVQKMIAQERRVVVVQEPVYIQTYRHYHYYYPSFGFYYWGRRCH